MKIVELMSHPVTTIEQHASLEEAAKMMLDNGFGCLPVVDDNDELVGLITESSFAAKQAGIPFSTFRAPQVLGQWLSDRGLEKIYASAKKTHVSDVMVRSVVTITEDEPVSAAVKLMLEHDINRLPVVRGRRPVGVIARHDLLRFLVSRENR